MYTALLPLAETAEALRSGELDLAASIGAACDRIDSAEQHLEALLPEPERRARLLKEAAQLQERFPDPRQRPALYGVLVGIKDLFFVDGFATHAGSRLPPELFTGSESSCVSALRKAGALVLGLTVATEFAYFDPGPTRNPWNTEHTPGGSSSGSAAAVAAGYCPLALGTQTTGSVIRPAAFCGIAGFKPSYGRIPSDGLIYSAHSLDTIGYFTQDLAGLQLVAPLICPDWQAQSPPPALPVLGIPEGPYLEQASDEALGVFERQVTYLEMAGYKVQRLSALADIKEITYRHGRLVSAEMARFHAEWFAQYATLYRPRSASAIREGQTISDAEYADYKTSPRALRSELEAAMSASGIDIWICPSAPGSAPAGITTTGNGALNLPWTHAGLPAVTLPATLTENGLPLGLQCVGRFASDEYLLACLPMLAEALSCA